MRDAFDQSFDFFERNGTAGDVVIDGWTSSKWAQSDALETSFESDPFEFSAISSARGGGHEREPDFFSEPFGAAKASPAKSGYVKIHVSMSEQLAALYDDGSTEGTVCVEGAISVKPSGSLTTPFYLVVRDLLEQIERVEEKPEVCQHVTDRLSSLDLHHADRVFRVSLPIKSSSEETPIMNYVCVPSLRPVPLLIKCRVRQSAEYTRVGFKVRANPSNESPLSRMMIILAVPPTMDGESVRMSRQGGMWDEMKRTISWAVPRMESGEALEIQAQFLPLDSGAVRDRPPTFPVLVRCEYAKLFSAVEVLEDYSDGATRPVKAISSLSGRILHRKV